MNRWQIAENIPFQSSFDGYIEKYFKNDRYTRYACMAYWYLSADGKDPYTSLGTDNRTNWYEKPVVKVVPGLYEGESLEVLGKSLGGNVTIQELFGDWSNNAQLWWVYDKPDGDMRIKLPAVKAGKYGIRMQFTKAADYGIFQMWIDGRPLGEPIDLYNNGVIVSGEVSLGSVDLTAGDHQLIVQNVGKNKKSSNYLFGLDYLRLVRAN